MSSLRKGKAEKEIKPVEVDEEVETSEEAEEVKVLEVEEKAPKAEALVRVKTNIDLRTYIGDQWYDFTRGVEKNVPKTVKVKLQEAGLLQAL